jgi:hypothetical protein
MNERIKELIEQCKYDNPEASTWTSFKLFNEEKFALLIVQNCLDWCNAHSRDDGTAQKIAESIKKEFGVE